MSYLERLQAKASHRADGELPKGSKGASDPFGSDPTGRFHELPGDIADGLRTLAMMRPPRFVRPDAWPDVVADARRLVGDGWAFKALALGWTALDLFGAVTAVDGDPASDGLAVWLAGRKLLAVEATLAVVRDGEGWSYYHRREQVGAKLLWGIGR